MNPAKFIDFIKWAIFPKQRQNFRDTMLRDGLVWDKEKESYEPATPHLVEEAWKKEINLAPKNKKH